MLSAVIMSFTLSVTPETIADGAPTTVDPSITVKVYAAAPETASKLSVFALSVMFVGAASFVIV